MSRNLLVVFGVVIIIGAIIATSATFVVRQTEQAIVLMLGDPQPGIRGPGLHFKLPFVQNVVYFESRILDYAPPQEEIIAADQKRLVVDSFARYRIADPLEFYKSVGTEISARARLAGILSASLRRVVGGETLASVLSQERGGIMDRIRADTNEAASKFGIDVVDFRIRRADLPAANADAIYQRMQSEREREAREFRAQGAELAQRIRARAEREKTVLIAESQRQSQVLRGEGDGEAIRVYADAFGQDPEFFAFYRSMEAYRNALKGDGTTMVLSPDSDFFAYFRKLSGGPGNDVGLPASAMQQPMSPAAPATPAVKAKPQAANANAPAPAATPGVADAAKDAGAAMLKKAGDAAKAAADAVKDATIGSANTPSALPAPAAATNQ
jgi:modulator of FtsH protease HflC